MIDLYKDNHVHACVCACVCAFINFFFKKTSSETIDWAFTKFHSSVPLVEAKIFFSSLQKNQACGVIQALKRKLKISCDLSIYVPVLYLLLAIVKYFW